MRRFNSAPEGSAAPLTSAASGESPGAGVGMGTCRAVCAPSQGSPRPSSCPGGFPSLHSTQVHTRCAARAPLAACSRVSCLFAPGQCTKSHLWPRSSCCQLCSGVGFACFFVGHVVGLGWFYSTGFGVFGNAPSGTKHVSVVAFTCLVLFCFNFPSPPHFPPLNF